MADISPGYSDNISYSVLSPNYNYNIIEFEGLKATTYTTNSDNAGDPFKYYFSWRSNNDNIPFRTEEKTVYKSDVGEIDTLTHYFDNTIIVSPDKEEVKGANSITATLHNSSTEATIENYQFGFLQTIIKSRAQINFHHNNDTDITEMSDISIWSTEDEVSLHYPGSSKPTKPTDGQYDFIGWSAAKVPSNNTTIYGFKEDIPVSNGKLTNIYAAWGNTISYVDPTGNNSTVVQIKKKNQNVTLEPPLDFSLDGYFIKDWNTQIDGGGTSYKSGQVYQDEVSITLYAIWEPIYYQVTFFKNDDTDICKVESLLFNSYVDLTDTRGFFRDGYLFIGWTNIKDSNIPLTEYQVTSSNVQALYAIWKEDSIMYVYKNGDWIRANSYVYKNGDWHIAPFKIYADELAQLLIDFSHIKYFNRTSLITDWNETLNGFPSTELIIPNNKNIIL